MSANKPTCTVCAKTFSNKNYINKHMRTVHQIEVESWMPLACPMCECRVKGYMNLASHMEEAHDMKMEKEEMAFACIKDFDAWKKKTEKENRSQYVKDTGSKRLANGKIRTLYRCNRDGSYRDHVGADRKRSLKSQGSCKIGAKCPSFIIMTEGAAKLRVTFYKRHFGHRLDLGHLFLSADDRLKIAGLLESGAQQSTVLDIVRDSCMDGEELQRIHMLTKLDMHNIARDFGLQKDITLPAVTPINPLPPAE